MDLPKLEDLSNMTLQDLQKLGADLTTLGEAVAQTVEDKMKQEATEVKQDLFTDVYGAGQVIKAKLADQYKTHIETIKIVIGIVALVKLLSM